MKIQGRKSFPAGPIGSPSVPGQAPAERPAPVNGGGGDRIDISPASREVGELGEAVKALPEVRVEKIEGIRGSIEEGSYHVESEKLAKRVVDEALQDAIRRDRNSNGATPVR